jgi:hypothetical protein
MPVEQSEYSDILMEVLKGHDVYAATRTEGEPPRHKMSHAIKNLMMCAWEARARSRVIKLNNGVEAHISLSPSSILMKKELENSPTKFFSLGHIKTTIVSPIGSVLSVLHPARMESLDFESLSDGELISKLKTGLSSASLALDGYEVNSIGMPAASELPPGYQGEAASINRELKYNVLSADNPFSSDGSRVSDTSSVLDDLVLIENKPWQSISSIEPRKLSSEKLFEELGLSDFYQENKNVITEALSHAISYNSSLDITEIYHRQNERFAEAGISFPRTEKAEYYYAPFLRNFIASAESPKSRQYRKEFVDQCYSMMFGSHDIEEWPSVDKIDKQVPFVIPSLLENDATRCIDFRMKSQNGFIIDDGRFPYSAIANKMGTPNMSKKEFRRAMAMVGLSVTRSNDSNYGNLFNDTPRTHEHLIKGAFALAKVPKEWVCTKPGDQNDAFIHPSDSGNHPLRFRKVQNVVKNALIKAGLKIDRLQGQGDNTGRKELSKKWRWIADNKSTYVEKLEQFDNKYNIEGTWEDYGTMLGQLLETVNFRIVAENPHIENVDECFLVDVDNADLDINEGILSRELKSYFNNRDREANYEELLEWESKEVAWEPPFTGEDRVTEDYSVVSFGDREALKDALLDAGEELDNEKIRDLLSGDAVFIGVKDTKSDEIVSVAEAKIKLGDGEFFLDPVEVFGSFGNDNAEKILEQWFQKNMKEKSPDIHWSLEKVYTQNRSHEVPYDEFFESDDYEDIDFPTAYKLKSIILDSVGNIKDMASLNGSLHKKYNRFIREANESSDNNIMWTPLFDGVQVLGPGVEVEAISNRLSLLEEGSEMNHCVFSYMSRCLSGDSIILSARNAESKERIATIELTPYEDSDGEISLEIEQCYGPGNSTDGDVELVHELMENWIQRYDNGKIETNIKKIIDEDLSDKLDLDEIEDNPSEKGEILNTIPYMSDGALMAYFLFDEMTPEGFSMESLISKNMTWNELYYASPFYKLVEQVRKISNEIGIAPYQVMRQKNIQKIDMDSLSETLGQQKEALSILRRELPHVASLEVNEGDIESIQEKLFVKLGVTLPSDVIGEVIKNPNLINDAITKLEPKKESEVYFQTPERPAYGI